jgi:hypothetical protein
MVAESFMRSDSAWVRGSGCAPFSSPCPRATRHASAPIWRDLALIAGNPLKDAPTRLVGFSS